MVYKKGSSSTNRLCETCTEIPFNTVNPLFGKDYSFDRWAVGTLGRIRKETGCPLCRLIGLAVYEAYQGQRDNVFLLKEDISILWDNLRDTNKREVISIDGMSSGLPFASWTKLLSRISFSQVHSWTGTGLVAGYQPAKIITEIYCNPTWNLSATTAISGVEVLRLIDVVNGCLVETRSPCRYLTLSYVWGGVNNVRLTSSNKAFLMEKGVLRTIWRLLPRTIRDAVEVVKALGEGLLWIDALCLVQNDAVDMQNGIEVMDLIYERAALCIVAASGDSADAGLPGARLDNRLVASRAERILPGIQLAVYSELDHVLVINLQ